MALTPRVAAPLLSSSNLRSITFRSLISLGTISGPWLGDGEFVGDGEPVGNENAEDVSVNAGGLLVEAMVECVWSGDWAIFLLGIDGSETELLVRVVDIVAAPFFP